MPRNSCHRGIAGRTRGSQEQAESGQLLPQPPILHVITVSAFSYLVTHVAADSNSGCRAASIRTVSDQVTNHSFLLIHLPFGQRK